MDLEEAIYGRRSIRNYDVNRRVCNEDIERIINAGMWAPTACNVQGWRFIIIDEKSVFDKILKEGAASFLENVNQAILVLYDNRTSNLEYNDYIQSASACIENMILYAYSIGIGTCWINNLPEKKKLKKILNVPWNFTPIAMISLGYADFGRIKAMPRKNDFQSVVSYNRYDRAVESKGIKYFKLNIKRIFRKLYYKFPNKKMLFKFASKFEKKFEN